jgi:hypothetical protein
MRILGIDPGLRLPATVFLKKGEPIIFALLRVVSGRPVTVNLNSVS